MAKHDGTSSATKVSFLGAESTRLRERDDPAVDHGEAVVLRLDAGEPRASRYFMTVEDARLLRDQLPTALGIDLNPEAARQLRDAPNEMLGPDS